MIHGIDKLNLGKIFCIDEDGRTRKHSLCLKIRRHVWTQISDSTFSLGVVNYWNHLPDGVVSCKSLSTFKMKLDQFTTADGEIWIYSSSINAWFISITYIIFIQSVGIWLRLIDRVG